MQTRIFEENFEGSRIANCVFIKTTIRKIERPSYLSLMKNGRLVVIVVTYIYLFIYYYLSFSYFAEKSDFVTKTKRPR